MTPALAPAFAQISRLILIAALLGTAAPFAAAEPVLFLVRHAEKMSGPASDPNNPELSVAGHARAELLGRMLKDAGIVAVFATEYTRTQQTAEAFRSDARSLTTLPAKNTSALIERLKTLDGNALVVGHSNTLPEIIKALGVEKAVTIADAEYDNLFIWNASTPREIVRLRY